MVDALRQALLEDLRDHEKCTVTGAPERVSTHILGMLVGVTRVTAGPPAYVEQTSNVLYWPK